MTRAITLAFLTVNACAFPALIGTAILNGVSTAWGPLEWSLMLSIAVMAPVTSVVCYRSIERGI